MPNYPDSIQDLEPLSGLYIRKRFLNEVRTFLDQKHPQGWCIVAIDIENFKLFNDWYGQDSGDYLLLEIAAYLRNLHQEDNYITGHFSADDFFICMPDDGHKLRHIYATISHYIDKLEQDDSFLPSIGVYRIEDESLNVSTMCNNAQIAASSVVGKIGNRICYFESGMTKKIELKQRILRDARHGLENHEFIFYLQPKCNMATGELVSMEALARWQKSDGTFVSPEEFIPLFESSGFITRFDMYIWKSVCKTLAAWQDKGCKLVPISINVSMIDITNIDVPQYLSMLTEQYHISPEYLPVEITESVFAESNTIVKNTITRFHEKGFYVLMDDFGSGYSSLNVLKDANVDYLKLDMKFMQIDAKNKGKGIQILKSIVDMAYRLGLVIIAEGVETKEQSEILKSMNCNYGQGFYFHRPMSVEAAEELIQTIPIENFRAAHEQVSRIRNVCESLPDSPEMWKLGDNIFRILLDHMLLLSRFNLITGGMETIKRDSSLAGFGMEYETDYQTYMSRLLDEQLVHPDDADEFRSIMTLDQLRLRMFHEKGSVIYRFRRKFKAGYFWTSLELFPDTECSKENPWVVMVIHESPSVNPDL